jgi:uncharacterized membrane protein (Fun14 family)
MAIAEIIGGFSGLKGRMLLFSGVVVLAGSIWSNGLEMQRSGKIFQSPASSVGSTLTGGGSSANREFYLRKSDVWSRGAVTLGLSFMVAMIAGSLLRAAFKTGVTLLVLCGVAVWILEKQGYVSLWDEYFQSVQQGGNWMTNRVEVLGKVLQDHLPSAGVALIGFGFGLRR